MQPNGNSCGVCAPLCFTEHCGNEWAAASPGGLYEFLSVVFFFFALFINLFPTLVQEGTCSWFINSLQSGYKHTVTSFCLAVEIHSSTDRLGASEHAERQLCRSWCRVQIWCLECLFDWCIYRIQKVVPRLPLDVVAASSRQPGVGMPWQWLHSHSLILLPELTHLIIRIATSDSTTAFVTSIVAT